MRRYKLFFLTLILLIGGVLGGGIVNIQQKLQSTNQLEEEKAMPVMAKSFELILRRTYLCGTMNEEKIQAARLTIDELLAKYIGWEIVSTEGEQIVLARHENDISPECKKNGYFGLTPDGMLTLFNGLPGEQKVIQTFYQINTARMEASLPKEELDLLRNGIRVHDLAEYNSILSTYGEFQSEDEKKE